MGVTWWRRTNCYIRYQTSILRGNIKMYDMIFNYFNDFFIANVEQIEMAHNLTKITIALLYAAIVYLIIAVFRFFARLVFGNRRYE